MKAKTTVILAMLFIFSADLAAQINSGFETTASAGMRTGKTTLNFPVKVWGEVTRPGIYDIPIGYDLLAVISYAGGPTAMAKLTSVRVIRQKVQEGEGDLMYVIDLERYLETGDKSLLPEVRPGDTVIVTPRFMKSVTQTMGYVQSILSIVNILVLMQYYANR
ncbi:MAG TPA: hypothetical protein ENN84_03190 [Candidatus Marinimicrobia bacterium]|nr:hypothetical protein [Candidatus Neomarinimicrobiota bacterium]